MVRGRLMNDFIIDWDVMFSTGEKTIPAMNCDIIKKKLEENDIPIQYVARHHLFGINYFQLVMKEDARLVVECEIGEILDIPSDWIGFTSVTPMVICVKEDELLEKYSDCDGLLEFDEFDLNKACHEHNFTKQVMDQLEKCDVPVKKVYWKNNCLTVITGTHCGIADVQNALNSSYTTCLYERECENAYLVTGFDECRIERKYK